MTHELKYKMNELILNFPKTLGLKRLSRLAARVFCLSPWSLNYLYNVIYLFIYFTNAAFSLSAPGQSGKLSDLAKVL